MASHTPERAVARVDLGAVERNCARLRDALSGGAKLCAVVKADGYGHGDVWCAKAAQAGGAEWLAVATAGEAAELRRHGISGRVLVMGALTDEELRTALEAGADVVAWREDFAREAAERAATLNARAPLHVKLDTGMGRLGTRDPEEATRVAELAAADERLILAGLMTHFATADEEGDEHFPAQLDAFTPWASALKKRFPDALVHAANSAATLREPAAQFDMVRCGVAVYGLDPFGKDPSERGLEPALALESYVAEVKRLDPGESAGYGRRFSAGDDGGWIGVVPIGYGDGWRRALSNNGDVLVRGRRRPIAGTISMDNLTIDLGSAEPDVQRGDRVVLIGVDEGERLLAEEVAERLGTINYEVTCGLLPRVRRVWSSG